MLEEIGGFKVPLRATWRMLERCLATRGGPVLNFFLTELSPRVEKGSPWIALIQSKLTHYH